MGRLEKTQDVLGRLRSEGVLTVSRGEFGAAPSLTVAATELRVGDLRILVASLDDIIGAKQISDRPKDRWALEELRALRGL